MRVRHLLHRREIAALVVVADDDHLAGFTVVVPQHLLAIKTGVELTEIHRLVDQAERQQLAHVGVLLVFRILLLDEPAVILPQLVPRDHSELDLVHSGKLADLGDVLSDILNFRLALLRDRWTDGHQQCQDGEDDDRSALVLHLMGSLGGCCGV